MFTRTDFPLARLSPAKPLPQAIYLQQLSKLPPLDTPTKAIMCSFS